jgi:cysteine-rich repeat protein
MRLLVSLLVAAVSCSTYNEQTLSWLLGKPRRNLQVCGDAVVSGPAPVALEGCDDGNKFNGDGCSDQCYIEEGFDCETWQYMIPIA